MMIKIIIMMIGSCTNYQAPCELKLKKGNLPLVFAHDQNVLVPNFEHERSIRWQQYQKFKETDENQKPTFGD